MKKNLIIILLFFVCSLLRSAQIDIEIDKKVPSDFFGLHMHRVLKNINPWPNVPFKVWRLWDAGICWPEIEKDRDKWDFTLVDKAIKLAEKNNVELVFNIGQSPRWASARPNNRSGYGSDITPAEPKDIEDWKNYVRVIGTRYKGKIKYWEIWNEPDMFLFYTGSVKKMVELVKEAYTILKEIDPENKIISPPITGILPATNWLDMFLYHGGKDYIDIIGTHYYPWLSTSTPEDSFFLVKKIKKLQQKYNIEHLPLWNTEGGYLLKNVNSEERIGFIARAAIVQLYYGIDCFIFYSYDIKHTLAGLIDHETKKPTDVADAFIEVQKWLVGSDLISLKQGKGEMFRAFLKRSNGNKAVIIWDSSSLKSRKSIFYDLPEDWKIVKISNLSGETLDLHEKHKIKISQAPILIEYE